MGYEFSAAGRVLYLPIRLVQPSQGGRGRMSVALQELAASIAQVGVLQPLTVRKQGGGYLVVSGNRRLMAARMAGLGEVPCLLLEVDETDGELIGLTENLQREDLHYFEEAECLERYLVHSGFTQAQAAKQLGRSQSAIANKLRLLHHSPRVREALRDRGLSERHARELLRVPGEQQRLLAVAEIGERHLSVAQTERYIDALLENARAPGEKLRRRDARLLLERVARDATSLRGQGVAAQLQHQPDRETLVLTVTLGNCEKPKERP